jgi:hypothetical protein
MRVALDFVSVLHHGAIILMLSLPRFLSTFLTLRSRTDECQPANRRRALCRRPGIELLEDRTLLSYTNVVVNNPAADTTSRDTQSETSLVLGSIGSVVVVYNDSGSAVSNTNNSVGYATSPDGGTSFTDRGALPNSTAGIRADTSLARDTTSGTIYLSALSFTPNIVQVWRSNNNGVSFDTPVNASPGVGSTLSVDKPWITVDNSSATGAGRGNVYVVYAVNNNTHDLDLNYSVNGGYTWSSPVLVAHNGQGAYMTVGPDHAVYVFYYLQSSPGHIMMAKSTNLARTFSPAITVATLATGGMEGELGLTVTKTSRAEFRTNSFPQAAVTSNGIFVTYNDVGVTAGDRADVFLSWSFNGGTTWMRRKLNADTTTTDQWQPALAMNAAGTALAVFWYDRRLDPTNNALIDRYGVTASVSGTTVSFGANLRITTASFPAVVNQDPGEKLDYMGDYDVAVANGTNFYTTWGDNRLSDAFHAHQPDVRLAVVPLTLGTVASGLTTADPRPVVTPFVAGGMAGSGTGFTIVVSQPKRLFRQLSSMAKAVPLPASSLRSASLVRKDSMLNALFESDVLALAPRVSY